MRTKKSHKEAVRGRQNQEPLLEVRAGLVLVRSNDASRSTRRARVTWVLPLLRMLALAASMLCLTPTGGVVTGISKMDAWAGGSESEQQQHEDRSHGAQHRRHQEHFVFVGVPEENAVLPLKALAQEMIARGYRASFALPHGFRVWVEDIPGLSFLSLQPAANPATYSAASNGTTHPNEPPTTSAAAAAAAAAAAGGGEGGGGALQRDGTSPAGHPCPVRPPGVIRDGRKPATACFKKGLGDAWGGGVGGGWGGGLGIWRGLRGSMVGAREFLGHLTAYFGFYRREEAAMYVPLLEALRRDPPALVIADRRATAAFRACDKLGLRCVVNSAGLLGDLDRPPISIPAPYTGFPLEGQTIAQRVHSTLFRLVLALSRLQAARDADHLTAAWNEREEPPPGFVPGDDRHKNQHQHQQRGHGQGQGQHRTSTVMALGNSCFGSLEYPRELPARVHMVGPLWMADGDGGGEELARDASGRKAPFEAHHWSRGGGGGSRRSWKAVGGDRSSSPAGGGREPAGGQASRQGEGGRETADAAASSPPPGSGADKRRRNKAKGRRKGGDVDRVFGAGGGGSSAVESSPSDTSAAPRAAGERSEGDKMLQKVWSWLEPEGLKEGEDAAPVVVVQLGYGGGWAWGVSPDAGVRGSEYDELGDRFSWKAFRDETASQLFARGCRILWLDRGPHSDHHERHYHHHIFHQDHHHHHALDGRDAWHGEHPYEGRSEGLSEEVSSEASFRRAKPRGVKGGGETTSGSSGQWEAGNGGEETRLLDGRRTLMFIDVEEEIGAAGMVGSSEWLLRVISHRLVTVLVTDGDVRSLQTALWHGKPSVVLPTSPDQREAAARLVYSGAGVTCPPPCNATELVAAVVNAHDIDKRKAALRSSAALRETGGVGRAADLLENELWTHLAATARRPGCPHGPRSSRDDLPTWCLSQESRAERSEERSEERLLLESEPFLPEAYPSTGGLSWFPDDPDWVWDEMSWLERHLVDVYAVYAALVVGVGLLMKLTWNIVWSLCDITTAPVRGDLGGNTDSSRSPSPSPAKDPCAPSSAVGGGKLARGGSGKWGSGGGGGNGGTAGGGGGGSKHGKGGAKHHGNGNMSGAAVVNGDGTPPVSGGMYSKRMALTYGHS